MLDSKILDYIDTGQNTSAADLMCARLRNIITERLQDKRMEIVANIFNREIDESVASDNPRLNSLLPPPIDITKDLPDWHPFHETVKNLGFKHYQSKTYAKDDFKQIQHFYHGKHVVTFDNKPSFGSMGAPHPHDYLSLHTYTDTKSPLAGGVKHTAMVGVPGEDPRRQTELRSIKDIHKHFQGMK